jgi:hypothetical protein
VFNKTSLFAFVAVAAIGAAALVSTASSADARGFGGGFSRGGGIHFGGFRSGSRFASFRFHHRPRWHHHRHWHIRWHRPWIYGVGTAAIAAPAYAAQAAKPAPGPCTCLSKEYTKENLVVFMDRCSKETAVSPMGGPQQPQQSQGQPPAPMPTK